MVLVQESAKLDQRVFLDRDDLLSKRCDCLGDRVTEALSYTVDQSVPGDIDGDRGAFLCGRGRLVTGCWSRFWGSGLRRRWLFGSAFHRRSQRRLLNARQSCFDLCFGLECFLGGCLLLNLCLKLLDGRA